MDHPLTLETTQGMEVMAEDQPIEDQNMTLIPLLMFENKFE
jgi:hypothetical protein